MEHSHIHFTVTALFYFEFGVTSTVIISASLDFSLSLVFRQGPHLRMMFFSLRFSPFCFLSLILMRTDLGVEPSTRWKHQIRPSGDRTPRGRRSPPDTGPDHPLQPVKCKLSQTSSIASRPLRDVKWALRRSASGEHGRWYIICNVQGLRRWQHLPLRAWARQRGAVCARSTVAAASVTVQLQVRLKSKRHT